MLITEVKKKEAILPELKGRTLLIACLGCHEVSFPLKEMAALKSELKSAGADIIEEEVIFDYMCREDFTQKRLEMYKEKISMADCILMFSCGVGIQTFAGLLQEKKVVSGSDTYYLPGFPGVTPLEYDCEQCGECQMGLTFGICPVTTCSKSLLNGPCGGAKNGKCEVSKEMDCGWQKIFDKMNALKENDKVLKERIKLRDYKKQM
ncbi:MAG: methylenetetrahydrofolate reductase C-terminal domain-containing protein [Candidatus Firestonebacteria bacterium]